jgi:hypothetical protein
MLRSVDRQLDTDVSGQPIGPILRFRHLEDGADRLSRNVGNHQYHHHHHHHHHKHKGLDPVIRSVSRVTTASAKVSSVFQLFSFLNHQYTRRNSAEGRRSQT